MHALAVTDDDELFESLRRVLRHSRWQLHRAHATILPSPRRLPAHERRTKKHTRGAGCLANTSRESRDAIAGEYIVKSA